ncbi:DUF1028 domain-containing protein [Roseibacterium sp. SDUM158017]|uniref:DUF1028 domain-containing protein n=1 Tax=Roseicyclus salinarum TaxID=3036773 RepID=UPI0024156F8F|nr:DUF1028 domain-containing protein [Roseibacterium sp. SDUM158017]MDG4647194.1 DUF1028 domain-containing protein [Roseibacterium sp. SDUM158017]
MTFSLLARDEKTGALVAAAATGAPCVGGWVIRGSLDAGLVASQGTAPSTIWREAVLRRMADGQSAERAVADVTGADPGRGHRQLSALDLSGGGGAFTGEASVAIAAHDIGPGVVVAGNMLSGKEVLAAFRATWDAGEGDLGERALAALRAAEKAGGDMRGLRSAALLVLHPSVPPLDLRVDLSETPLADLAHLLRASRTPPYSDWLKVVPVAEDPHRAPEAAPEP